MPAMPLAPLPPRNRRRGGPNPAPRPMNPGGSNPMAPADGNTASPSTPKQIGQPSNPMGMGPGAPSMGMGPGGASPSNPMAPGGGQKYNPYLSLPGGSRPQAPYGAETPGASNPMAPGPGAPSMGMGPGGAPSNPMTPPPAQKYNPYLSLPGGSRPQAPYGAETPGEFMGPWIDLTGDQRVPNMGGFTPMGPGPMEQGPSAPMGPGQNPYVSMPSSPGPGGRPLKPQGDKRRTRPSPDILQYLMNQYR